MLQCGYLLDREEGHKLKLVHPLTFARPWGAGMGGTGAPASRLLAPLLYILGSFARGGDAVIPPPNRGERMGLWSCCMASTSSGACI